MPKHQKSLLLSFLVMATMVLLASGCDDDSITPRPDSDVPIEIDFLHCEGDNPLEFAIIRDLPLSGCGNVSTSFQLSSLPLPRNSTNIRDADTTPGGTVTAIGGQGNNLLFKISDVVGTWSSWPIDIGENIPIEIATPTDEIVYLACKPHSFTLPYSLRRSTDGGFTFDVVSTLEGNIEYMHFDNDQRGFVAVKGHDGNYRNFSILQTDDGGQSWRTSLSYDEYSFTAANKDFLWVEGKITVAARTGLHVLADENQWEFRPYPPDTYNTDEVSFGGGSFGIFSPQRVENSTRFYVTTDGGRNWIEQHSLVIGPGPGNPPYLQVNSVYADETGRGLIIHQIKNSQGNEQTLRDIVIYGTTDGGVSWCMKKVDSDCFVGQIMEGSAIMPLRDGRRFQTGTGRLFLFE